MQVLRTATFRCSVIYDADEEPCARTMRTCASRTDLTAQIAMIVAVFDRIRKGKDCRRGRPVPLPRGQFPVDAEW